MLYLIISVLSSAGMMLLFKAFERYNVNTFQSLIVNYITAAIWCNLMAATPIILSSFWNLPWFPITLVLGILFIGIFYASAITAQRIAVSVSIVASKMSLIITVIWVSWYMDQPIPFLVWLGVGGSLVAVWLTTKRPETIGGPKQSWLWLLPIIVFVGSGFVDSSLKYLEQNYFVQGDVNEQLGIIFMIAGLTGILFLLCKYIFSKNKNRLARKKKIVWWKPLIGGAFLGSLNYISTLTMLKTLNLNLMPSHSIIAVINVGIVAITSLAAVLLYKEKLSKINISGIVLAILFICLIAWASVGN